MFVALHVTSNGPPLAIKVMLLVAVNVPLEGEVVVSLLLLMLGGYDPVIDHEVEYPLGMFAAVNTTVTCNGIIMSPPLDLACGEARFGVIEILAAVDVAVTVADPPA